MKKKISIALVLVMLVTFSGCAKVIALTEDEQNLIAQYASYTMIKHSRYNDSLLLSREDLEKELKKQEEDTENKDDKDNSESKNPESMTSAIGISGIEITYNGYEVFEEYSESIVTLPDRAGKKYVFLNFNLSNTSGENKGIDMITAKAKFKAVINGTAVTHLPTLLPSDMATFNKKTVIAAGEKKNVFIVFEVSDGTAKEIKSLSLSMTKDGNSGAVAIKLS